MTTLFKCIIPGRAIVKKNTKRIVGAGRFKKIIYSKRFQFWEASFVLYLRKIWKLPPIDHPVEAIFKFYFKNHQGEADTSNLIEGPQDCLVKGGVLKDDRLVQRLIAEKHFECEPMTEIELRML